MLTNNRNKWSVIKDSLHGSHDYVIVDRHEVMICRTASERYAYQIASEHNAMQDYINTCEELAANVRGYGNSHYSTRQF